jgi:hypothetical protein
MHATLPLELPQTDDEAQQIATSRALATAKDILQKGGTQAEAAEGAKAVARQILKEFQLAKQAQHSVQTEEVQVAEMDVGLVSLALYTSFMICVGLSNVLNVCKWIDCSQARQTSSEK